MVKVLNIIGDLHNFDSLKKLLDKFDNLISAGDIGATIEKEEFFNNVKRYNICFKAFTKQDFSMISEEDKTWFKKINVDGWKKQLDTIKNSNKKIMINMGNADLAMISFFPECLDYLNKTLEKSKLEFIKKPLIAFFEDIQLIFLPFTNIPYDIKYLLEKIKLDLPLFILGHCPVFKTSKKEYYMHAYKALELITQKYGRDLFYIHGHIHPGDSYKYSKEEFPTVTFLTPKAEENFDGINVNHHIIQINAEDGSLNLLDSVTNKFVLFKDLPKKFESEEGHWNDFESKIRK